MKTLKKLASLLLAVALLATLLVVPAGAAEHSITITGGAGHTFKAYQIFKGDLSGNTLSNIEWSNDVNGDVILNDLKAEMSEKFTDACATADDVANVMKASWVEENTKKFAQIVAPRLTVARGTGEENGSDYVISDLPAGYYLVKDETATLPQDAYSRYIVSVPTTDTITIKKSLPTLEKKVSRSPTSGYVEAVSATVDEDVYFTLTATMHKSVADYDAYKLVFKDTLPAGLTFKKLEAAYVNLTPVNVSNVVVDSSSSPVTFTVADARGLINTATGNEVVPDDQITIVFSAKVNANATYGKDGKNVNKATLSYSNNPHNAVSMGETAEQFATVYTYQMQITKKDRTTSALLGGAKFKLSFESEQLGKVVYLKLTDNGEGVYTVLGLTENVDEATEVVTPGDGSNKGIILIKGVGSKSYHLQETEAPEGYNDIKTAQLLVIKGTANTAGELTQLDVDKDGTFTIAEGADLNTGLARFSVVNNQGAILPSTGGMGTTIFYVLGAVMMIGAAVVLISKKRFAQG